MTTELRVRRAHDVFATNEVIKLTPGSDLAGMRLAGAAWLYDVEPTRSAHLRAVSQAASHVRARFVGIAFWLLGGQTTWQPDSRVVRHHKLWGALKARGLSVPFGKQACEGVVVTSQGLRHFAALQLGWNSLDQAVAVLEAEPLSHLIALGPEHAGVVHSLVRKGWDCSSFGPSNEVLMAVCSIGGSVFWPLGAFDDREAGAAVIAKPEVIEQLLA